MKTATTNPFPASESWSGDKSKLKQLFAFLTGYDIISEGSRKDLKLAEHKL